MTRLRAPIAPTLAAAAAAILATCLLAASPAQATRPLTTGLLDDDYVTSSDQTRTALFNKTVDAHAGLVRIGVSWRTTVSDPPLAPTNPGDPAYDFRFVDAAVREAAARGLDVVLTVTGAPVFAQGADRPRGAEPGTWKPDPQMYGDFARAVATRYSGSYTPPLGTTLPHVRYYQAWNEPNFNVHLAPQYQGGAPFAPAHYRLMLNAFYANVKAVDPADVVVTGGTGPYGDPPGGSRTRPLAFWRDVLCLQRNGSDLEPTGCPTKAQFDILAHHPINTTGEPTKPAFDPDDVTIADFGELRDTLRAAERAGTTGTPGNHELWATEFWWDSDPPDSSGVPLKRHARWIQQSLYLLWKQGAAAAIYLRVEDVPSGSSVATRAESAGLLFADGKPKPAFRAFRFPLVAARKGQQKKITVWGKAPAGGRLLIQRKGKGGWRKAKRFRVSAGAVFKKRVPVHGTAKVRAKVAGQRSLVWSRR